MHCLVDDQIANIFVIDPICQYLFVHTHSQSGILIHGEIINQAFNQDC